MNQKKRELSEWEKSECAALKAAIEEYNRVRPKKDRITQEQAGATLGMNQGSFSNYLNGRLALNLDFALKVSRLFDIPVERFSKRLAKDIEDIISTGNQLPDVEYYLSESELVETTEYPRPLRRNLIPAKSEDRPPDFVLKNDKTNYHVFVKGSFGLHESLSHAVHQGTATPYQLRLRQLIEKLQHAVANDRVTDKDIELLESMLDRLMDMGAPYTRESNEHFEKH
jgi:transcriptional regulator with XRE-family HTH domain